MTDFICPEAEHHGNPFRYCPVKGCGWMEKTMHPATKEMLKYFEYAHLPEHLQIISGPFCDLAHKFAALDLNGPEVTVCLRKLLEAKDCAVRAAL